MACSNSTDIGSKNPIMKIKNVPLTVEFEGVQLGHRLAAPGTTTKLRPEPHVMQLRPSSDVIYMYKQNKVGLPALNSEIEPVRNGNR